MAKGQELKSIQSSFHILQMFWHCVMTDGSEDVHGGWSVQRQLPPLRHGATGDDTFVRGEADLEGRRDPS